MAFRFTFVRRTAIDELMIVGSRWRRISATPITSVGPPHAQAGLAVPFITLIPSLHIASINFYDRVLEYMQLAVKRSQGNCKILLEGICDDEEAEKQQMKEYLGIVNDETLRMNVIQKADENNLHSPQVMQEICAELALDFKTVMKNSETVRLQECYLRPKMAALVGNNLVNNVDTDMKGVQRLLKQEEARLTALGQSLPSSIAVSDLGQFPLVRKYRERKVAEAARIQCEKWIRDEIEGEVIIPWGYFHIDAIAHYIVQGNRTPSASKEAGSSGEPVEPKVAVFTEADELVAKVDFGITKELFTSTNQETGDEQLQLKVENEEDDAEKKKKERRNDDFSTF